MHPISSSEAIEELRRKDPLSDFFTWWDRATPDDLAALAGALDDATREEDIQQFLQLNPHFLIQHLGGGHGRWVLPKQKLGAEYVTDFLIAEKHSFGFDWQAVELESPLRPMFNKNGDPSQHLNHAIRQITDWRAWLKSNQSYASRPRTEGGLGLTDIDANLKGLILIGRRAAIDPETNARRRQLVQNLNIEIHSFDYLLQSLEGRLVALRKIPEQKLNE
ncbi:Shedu anti-phage system protein SduA domain-containing protein [Permianibacter aggregans]|uniref:Uncharacterized protein DUF4263 n=1 Tax=Permianibacter aggregans TaxID=1510150 RepID=A0A4R6UKQ7_9GAMM|nr:Shedu anti-phage system protein SduA domain-containing protein [Permianibacter aggregans]QGX40208.1 DUF4263 domain-containing protein [Permianibacter aggregans]TDQ47461.1 uncharacterized protein DUF4263 [Permianibacter aggregans]